MADSGWRYSVNGLVPEGQVLPEGVKRYAAAVEYNGRLFCGWQRQSHSPSVQQAVEEALGKVANGPLRLACAGRTDTGVHATNQIVHFDSDVHRQPRNWLLGANTHLPEGVHLHWVSEVSPQFHARFSARARTYRYIIANQWVRPALFSGLVTWARSQLDAQAMHEAAQALVGENDFSAFRAAGCQSKTPFRCIEQIAVRRHGTLVMIEVTANAFLHHMVRNIAGSLMAVGRGEQPVGWIAELLAARDRTRAEVTAPPDGLYLVSVTYPSRFGIPDFEPGPLLAC